MLAADEDALVCDLAETYGLLDYRAHGARLVATLAVGLRPYARIWRRLDAGDTRGFDSGAAFDAARERILKAR